MFSCTAIQHSSQSALQLLCWFVKAGKCVSCQQDATSLLNRQTHTCYSLLRLHMHLALSFESSILFQAIINERRDFLCMSKGFCCPFLSSSLPLIKCRRTLQLWVDLSTLIPNAIKYSCLHKLFKLRPFCVKKRLEVALPSCTIGNFSILLIQRFTSDDLD